MLKSTVLAAPRKKRRTQLETLASQTTKQCLESDDEAVGITEDRDKRQSGAVPLVTSEGDRLSVPNRRRLADDLPTD
jgi:hypothetical protein